MAHTPMRRKKTQGSALVEMTLSLMLLIILCFGAIEYGWVFFRLQQVSNTARAGARQAVLPDATNGDVTTVVNNLMTAHGLADTGYTVTTTPADVSAAETGDLITVRVELPYGAEAGLLQLDALFGFSVTPSTLPCEVAMAKEGPL